MTHRSSVRLWAARLGAVAASSALVLGTMGALAAAGSSAAGAATSGFAVANGFASYTPASELAATTAPTPVTFTVTTLASGGTADPATLAITSKPASGTASADTTTGVITYTAGSGTTGTQTVGFTLCTGASTTCRTATLTFAPSTAVNSAFVIPFLGGYTSQPFHYAMQAPSSVVPGTTFQLAVASAGQTVPTSLAVGVLSSTINYVSELGAVVPVPANATYVPGSAHLVGGTAKTTGHVTVTYCTTFGNYTTKTTTKPCRATQPPGPTGTFPTATTKPYLMEMLTPTVHVAGGTTVTLPTLVASFTASGANGSVVRPAVTETDLTVDISVLPKTPLHVATYPTTPSFTGAKKGTPAPAYHTYRLALVNIATSGYWEVAADGGIFSFGTAQFYGSMGGKPLNQPVVGMASTPDHLGYWEVARDGGIFSFGDANFYGSMGGQPLNKPIVGMVPTPDAHGYWEVASDGGIFSFGDANFYGSAGGQPLVSPIVGMAATADGKGYWEVAANGGILAFGDANFFGSLAGQSLASPIVGMEATPDGLGYWEVAADGAVFAFGDAGSYGSMGGQPLNKPVVGMAATPDAHGYWLAASDGGIFSFGDAGFFGSMGGQPLNQPVVGMANASSPPPHASV